MNGRVVTVTGEVDPVELGLCYPHEHLLTAPPEAEDDLVLDSEQAALRELRWFQSAGGRSLVEMTPADYGRDVRGLRRLARRSGIRIIATTGWHKDAYCRPWVEGRSLDDLVSDVVRDLTLGPDGTGIRMGVIKVATSLGTITPAERLAIRAAARGSIETGAPIFTHTEAGTMAEEQLDLLVGEGVSAERIAIGHVDRRLDFDAHRALMDRGATLIYDQISKEKYTSDARRVETLARLIDAGYADRLMLSGDLARRSYLPGYGTGGGPGLTYLLWRFLPWLRSEGVSEDAITTITVRNPAKRLTWR